MTIITAVVITIPATLVQHAGPQFPDQGLNPCLLRWERGVLTAGLLGKSLTFEL